MWGGISKEKKNGGETRRKRERKTKEDWKEKEKAEDSKGEKERAY